MPQRSRISVTIDARNHILLIRLHSLRDPRHGPDLIDHLRTVDQAWTYDAIFDFRRYEAELSREYLSFLTQKWSDLTQGRDTNRRMALISPCPVLHLQLRELRSAMPDRNIGVFESFDDGLDWLKDGSDLAAA